MSTNQEILKDIRLHCEITKLKAEVEKLVLERDHWKSVYSRIFKELWSRNITS